MSETTMNINIYIEDKLGEKITQAAKARGMSRNLVIRDALKEWLQHHKAQQWPASIQRFKGVSDFPEFESYRDELEEPKEDPFA